MANYFNNIKVDVYSRENVRVTMSFRQILQCPLLHNMYNEKLKNFPEKFVTPISIDDLLIVNAILNIGYVPLEKNINFRPINFKTIRELCVKFGLYDYLIDNNGDFTNEFKFFVGDDLKRHMNNLDSIDDIDMPILSLHRH